jgi:hypothetical protein
MTHALPFDKNPLYNCIPNIHKQIRKRDTTGLLIYSNTDGKQPNCPTKGDRLNKFTINKLWDTLQLLKGV